MTKINPHRDRKKEKKTKMIAWLYIDKMNVETPYIAMTKPSKEEIENAKSFMMRVVRCEIYYQIKD